VEKLRSLKESILQLLYPDHAVCMGCGDLAGTEEDWLCTECREELKQLYMQGRPLCVRCGSVVRNGQKCRNCADWPADAVQLSRYCVGYDHPVDAAIMKMKYDGVYRMTKWMAQDMAELIASDEYGSTDLLVPVPMHPKRLRERGRNHALCLSQEISHLNGIPVWTGLHRVVNTKQQARLKGEERKQALRGAFAVAEDAGQIAGKRIVLIDDVITTGTTVNSCARVLYAKGVSCVCAAAWAGHLSAAEKTDVQKGEEPYAK